MRPIELERYLYEHIPLSRAMAVSVAELTGELVRLRAPLGPNINHRETVFGGSASALAILAGWCLTHTRLTDAGLGSRVVIQRNEISYDRPMAGPFEAVAQVDRPGDWQRFERTLARRGRARITVAATLESEATPAGRLVGDYVALRG